MFAEPKYLSFTASPAGGMRLYAEQLLPAPRQQVFDLFSDAFKLEDLTPPWLQFHVVTPRPIDIKQGTLIDYRLRLHGIWIRWQSKIEIWEPPLRFVDVQTHGPYRRWRHEHSFLESTTGTLCKDSVEYAVPGGSLIERLFVRRDVKTIFQFRQHKLAEMFPKVVISPRSAEGTAKAAR